MIKNLALINFYSAVMAARSLLLYCLIPFLWIFSIILRQFAIITATFRPDFGKPLSWLDVMMLENYNKRHRLTLPVTMLLDGDMSLPKLKNLATKNLLEAAKTKSGNAPVFPELKQYQVTWMGFLFWRNDPNFNIDNHVHEIFADGNWNNYEFILTEMASRPYLPHVSPWEVILIRNFTPDEAYGNRIQSDKPKSLLIWRSHHSMTDGISIVHIHDYMAGVINSSKTAVFSSKKDTGNFFSKLSQVPQYIQAFFNIQKLIWNNFRLQYIFHKRISDGNLNGKMCVKLLARLSKEEVKALARKHKVRVPSLIMAVLGNRLGTLFKSKIPLNSVYVLPVPNHPGNLTNHSQISSIELPTDQRDSIVLKMQKVNESFLNLKNDPTPTILNALGYFAGTLFPFMTKYLRSASYMPVSITNFAGSAETSYFEGLECISYLNVVAPLRFISGATLIIYGSKDDIQVVCCADQSFMSEQQVATLAQGISFDFHDELGLSDLTK